MLTSPEEYKEIEAIFQLELKRFRLLLPEDDIEAVQRYLANTEIEMAFELFGLSIIHHQICPPVESAKNLLSLGLRLHLDKESVYDTHFWSNFTNYLKSLGLKSNDRM